MFILQITYYLVLIIFFKSAIPAINILFIIIHNHLLFIITLSILNIISQNYFKSFNFNYFIKIVSIKF